MKDREEDLVKFLTFLLEFKEDAGKKNRKWGLLVNIIINEFTFRFPEIQGMVNCQKGMK